MLLYDIFNNIIPEIFWLVEKSAQLFEIIINTNCKEVIISLSFIYYFTVFFYVVRIIIYFGVTIIDFLNYKHTTNLRSLVSRKFTFTYLKFYNISYRNFCLKSILTFCM